MKIINYYEKQAYNGGIGIVTALDAENKALTIEYDERAVAYGFGDLGAIVLSCAAVIHKAQAPEVLIVVLVLKTKHSAMLERRPIYITITQGKRLVVIIDQKTAVLIAVKGKVASQRWSKLREWLTGDVNYTPLSK